MAKGNLDTRKTSLQRIKDLERWRDVLQVEFDSERVMTRQAFERQLELTDLTLCMLQDLLDLVAQQHTITQDTFRLALARRITWRDRLMYRIRTSLGRRDTTAEASSPPSGQTTHYLGSSLKT